MIAAPSWIALTLTNPVVFNRVIFMITADGQVPSFRHSPHGRQAIEVYNDLILEHARYQAVLNVLKSMRPAYAAKLAQTMEGASK